MSASLVGSEMCIRDRGRRGATGVAKVLQKWCKGVAKVLQRCCKGVAKAVSYTHLTLPTICSV
eukprot:1463203-Alexandrium_andersonii.AAC.1